jgi:hypothetical protein
MDRARRRRRLYLLVAGLVALALLTVLIARGCGDDESAPETGDARAAVAAVTAFEQAIVDRDYARICERLFTVEAREAAGGGNCQSVLAQNAGRIRNPRVQITSVVLRGDTAAVSVVAQVRGGPEVPDTIRLARDKDGYRISSAGLLPGES